MKWRRILVGLLCLVLLAGCVTNSSERVSYNHLTGKLTLEWIDLRSKKGPNEENYSLDRDWESLRSMLQSEDSDYDEGVIEELGKELYQDGDVLSGRMDYRVRCPECFPGPVDVFKYLFGDDEDFHFEEVRGDIFLYLPVQRKVHSTNGQLVESENNWVIVWPKGTESFDFTIRGKATGGTSLLPSFLADEQLSRPAP